ncbi:MAG: AraC family transcriptional regulator [Verrucomicrobia bacterium]|nr:AraC family transcriptional regulator [Verrucomicrobiota bacterium]
MKFLGCGTILPDPGWRMRPHFHPFHELIAIKSGSMRLNTEYGAVLAQAGDVLFYEAGLIHEEISVPQDPVNTLFLSFSSDQILPALPLRLQDPERRVLELLGWMLRDQHEGRPTSDCLKLLDAILQELQWILSRPSDAWLARVRDNMKTRYADKLSLADVSRHAGMSRFAFVRKFKRLTGNTPMEELRRIRLHAARNLILSSDLPMKAIAASVGIGDEYQLSKQFRREFGVSPSRIRDRPSAI